MVVIEIEVLVGLVLRKDPICPSRRNREGAFVEELEPFLWGIKRMMRLYKRDVQKLSNPGLPARDFFDCFVSNPSR